MSEIHLYNQKAPDNSRRNFAFTTAIGVALGAAGATATAIGVGVTGLAAYGAFRGIGALVGKPNTPSVQGVSQGSEPSYDRAASLAQKDEDAKRRGIARNKPTYTSAGGLTPTDQSNLNLKTLTGV